MPLVLGRPRRNPIPLCYAVVPDAVCAGSFSFMVNYHAIQELIQHLLPRGAALALNTAQVEGTLKITSLICCPTSRSIATDFATTVNTYRQHIDEFGLLCLCFPFSKFVFLLSPNMLTCDRHV
jgi:hypothetical protein